LLFLGRALLLRRLRIILFDKRAEGDGISACLWVTAGRYLASTSVAIFLAFSILNVVTLPMVSRRC
jgi:hypothetical protein